MARKLPFFLLGVQKMEWLASFVMDYTHATAVESKDRHSIAYLRYLIPFSRFTLSETKPQSHYRRISKFINEMANSPSLLLQAHVAFANTLGDLVEILVWADNNSLEDYISIFVEQKIHAALLSILKSCSNDQHIVLSILKFFNVFFESIKNTNTIFFMLSNSYINSVIGVPLPFQNDEVSSFYISLLKNIARKTDSSTIHLLMVKDDLPLFDHALSMHNHSESMVRIGARTIVLNLLKVGDAAATSHIIQTRRYFTHLCSELQNHTQQLIKHIGAQGESLDATDKLETIDELLDHVLEFFGLDLDIVHRKLAETLLDQYILGFLVKNIVQYDGNTAQFDVSVFILVKVVMTPYMEKNISRITIEAMLATQPSTLVSNLLAKHSLERTARRKLMAAMKPSENYTSLSLVLALLYAALSVGDKEVLLSSSLLPIRIHDSNQLLSALTDTKPLENSSGDLNFLDIEVIHCLLGLLASEQIFHFPMLTTNLIMHLLLELLEVSGKSPVRLPESTIEVFRTTYETSKTRLSIALEIDSETVIKCYEFEKRQIPPSLNMCIQKKGNIIKDADRPKYSLFGASLIHLNVALYTWLSFRQLMTRLNLLQCEPIDKECPSPSPSVSIIGVEVFACIVQVTVEGRVNPPQNWYFVVNADYFLLAASEAESGVDSHNIASDKPIVYYREWHRIKVNEVPQGNQTIDVIDHELGLRCSRAECMMIGLEGFDLGAISPTNDASNARLVFRTTEMKDEAFAKLKKLQMDNLMIKKKRLLESD